MNNEFNDINDINEEVIEITSEEVETVEEKLENQTEEETPAEEEVSPDFTVTKHTTKKKKRVWHKVVALSLVGGILAGTAFGIANNLSTKFMRAQIPIESTKVTLSKAETPYTEGSTISQIAQACMPSIVAITNRGESDVLTFFGRYTQESTSSGSGIIIGKNDEELLIVTNYHVVANSKELSVVFSSVEEKLETGVNGSVDIEDNELIPQAVVKGYNSDKDLAVIAVSLSDIPSEIFSEIKIATIGDSSALKPGDSVVAIGNALGYGQSVTTGIISAVNRKITMESSNGSSYVTNSFIQTDAAINPGNSGGALLNMAGELIGINSVKIASSGVEGMGYAIPITDVSSIIDELMIKETRSVVDEDKQGFLGISGQDVTASVSQSFGMPEGVFVVSVMENLAADNAGIKKGNIITEIDGYTVTSIAQLQERLTYYKKGETVKVKIQVQTENGYKGKTVEVKLSSRAENIDE